MDFIVKKAALDSLKTDCLVLTMSLGGKLSPKVGDFDKKTKGLLRKVINRNGTKGDIGETLFFQDVPGVSAERVLLVGIGDQKKGLTLKSYRKFIAQIVNELSNYKIKQPTSDILDVNLVKPDGVREEIETIIKTFHSRNYIFSEQKSEIKKNSNYAKNGIRAAS